MAAVKRFPSLAVSMFFPMSRLTSPQGTQFPTWTKVFTALRPTVRCISTSGTPCLPHYVKRTYLNKWGRRDIKRRELFAQYEFERDNLRLLKSVEFLPVAVRTKAAEDLAALPRDSCIIRVRNRCTITSRARGNVTRYRISRIIFREFADKGLIAGYTRSSW